MGYYVFLVQIMKCCPVQNRHHGFVRDQITGFGGIAIGDARTSFRTQPRFRGEYIS